MERFSAMIAMMLLVAACARLPVIPPLSGRTAETVADSCRMPYAAGSWQFVHALSSEADGARLDRLIGVSVIDTRIRTADAALMTVEGMLVFAAQWNKTLSVSRALPPFDSRQLAEGLMADIRFLFFPPQGHPAAVGQTRGGLPTCRYITAENTTVDVIIDPQRGWEVHRYDPRGRRTRTVKARDLSFPTPEGPPLARKIELTAAGTTTYLLKMDLISAEPIRREQEKLDKKDMNP